MKVILLRGFPCGGTSITQKLISYHPNIYQTNTEKFPSDFSKAACGPHENCSHLILKVPLDPLNYKTPIDGADFVIDLMRNPIDLIASYLNKHGERSKTELSANEIIKFWDEYAIMWEKSECAIKYEDIFDLRTFDKIYEYCGLEPFDCLKEHDKFVRPVEMSEDIWAGQLHSPLYNRNKRYRHLLNKRHKEKIEQLKFYQKIY